MNSAMPVAWMFMLLLILMVFAALAAIIWRSWIVGSIVIVFLVLVVGIYFVRISADSTAATPSVVILKDEIGPALERWEPGAETIGAADLYPSLEEGVKNVALRLCETIQLSQASIDTDQIHIVSAKKDRSADIVKEVFKDAFPKANVRSDDIHSGDGDPAELMVTVEITDLGRTTRNLKFRASQNQRNFAAEARVQDAPWVSNLDEYRSANPNGEWIVGRSLASETIREGAMQQARQDAASQMLPFVVAKFPLLKEPNADQRWLRSRLEQEIARRRFVKEEFVQRLQLPVTGHTVYRAAILVDASSAQLEKLHSSVIREVYGRNDRVRSFSLGTVGMGLFICLVYLFLNWATRGYFQMNLRLGAFLVLVAGVLLLLMIG